LVNYAVCFTSNFISKKKW